MDLQENQMYLFKFRLRRDGLPPPPDTRGRVIQVGQHTVTVQVGQDTPTWNKFDIKEAIPLVTGGRRRKSTRKARKSTRKSRRSNRK